MSAANAAAKKRRAPSSIQPEVSRPNIGNNASQQGKANDTHGLTLPQVISLIDKRLIQLELFTKNIHTNLQSKDGKNTSTSNIDKTEIMNTIMDEFNSRFEIMAEEIADIKNIVLNLQSYTMGVNKMLLQNLQTSGQGMAVFNLSSEDDKNDEIEEVDI